MVFNAYFTNKLFAKHSPQFWQNGIYLFAFVGYISNRIICYTGVINAMGLATIHERQKKNSRNTGVRFA